ncbi:DUF2251 domain-containing protein [Hymenobacter siberiensis]|uniref:DUF2251 domain-containing protein n=1 Tax=Hymenobacter siberiensis TaxID=2848396 RepID=UPI001C1DDB34|nr:DUF2251 domain-containing protein [Hymenobacter siberiensis]
MQLGVEAKITIGTPNAFIESTSAAGTIGVVFEDDGTTGYLYAVRPGTTMELLDALHIYDVANVADRQVPVRLQVFWDVAGTAAALLINGYCHALFDFQRMAGFCRTAFPAVRNGQVLKRELTDELIEQYFAA